MLVERAGWGPSLGIGVVIAATLALPTGAPPAARRMLQTAAFPDGKGFLVLERGPLQRVTVLGQDARPVGDPIELHRLPVNARAIGLAIGRVALVYQDAQRLAIDLVEPDGELRRVQTFGTSVDHLCDGVASNEHRFGVAWTEADGAVNFIHGPIRRAFVSEGIAQQPRYCGIANAGDRLALAWGTSHFEFVTCNETGCGRPARARVPGGRVVHTFGCTRSWCGVALHGDGEVELQAVAMSGRTRWTLPIPDAARDSQVAVVGVDRQQLAVGYQTLNGFAVAIVDKAGKFTRVWHGAADGPPALSWNRDRLVVARHLNGALAIVLLSRDQL